MILVRGWMAAAAVAGLMVEGAFAADMPVKAPPVPAAQGYDWSGAYVGAHAGYAFGVDQTSAPMATDFVGSHGFTGGLLGGYNFVAQSRWLFGVEGDVTWTDNAHTDTVSDPVFGQSATLKLAQGPAWSLRGRFGYLVTPETLLYGTAGWAWSSYTFSVQTVGIGGLAESSSLQFSGPQVGLGIETRLDAHFSARIEYLVTLYNTGTFNDALFLLGGNPVVRPSVQVGRAALVYNFGSGAPVAATAPPPAPGWNGLYVGGELGVGVANSKISFLNTFPNTLDGVGIPAVGPTGLIGYDLRVAPRVVFGAEAEAAPGFATSSFKLGWTTAVRAKLGYLVTPSTMVYGTVGWCGSGIQTSALTSAAITVPAQRVNALEVGGGIETAITANWLARFEYHYAAAATLNDITLQLGNGNVVNANASPQFHNMHLGVSYLFDAR